MMTLRTTLLLCGGGLAGCGSAPRQNPISPRSGPGHTTLLQLPTPTLHPSKSLAPGAPLFSSHSTKETYFGKVVAVDNHHNFPKGPPRPAVQILVAHGSSQPVWFSREALRRHAYAK